MLCSRLAVSILLSLWILPLFLEAQQASVVVESVEFDTDRPDGGREAWFEIAVKISANEASERGQPSVVKMKLELAVEARASKDFVFMASEVAFFLPERNEAKTIYFYLPPAVVERMDIRQEPFGWRVSMEHGGNPVALTAAAFSQNLREREAAQSFARRAAAEASKQAGWLQPIYLTPFYRFENGRSEVSPSYLRHNAPLP